MHVSWQALRDGGFTSGEDKSGSDFGKMEGARWTTRYHQLLELKVIGTPFDREPAYTLQFVETR